MPRQKMMPPLPESDESEYERFKRFATAILAVPKSEIMPAEQALARLEAEKRKIESKITDVRRKMAKPATRRKSV